MGKAKIKLVRARENYMDAMEVGKDGIVSIVDHSLEYDDSIQIMFTGYALDGEPLKDMIGGALSVEYFRKPINPTPVMPFSMDYASGDSETLVFEWDGSNPPRQIDIDESE
jgi:hypothetical protein